MPTYNGLNNVDVYLDAFEKEVPIEVALLGVGQGSACYTPKMVGYTEG